MICPRCGDLIGINDSIVMNAKEGWLHKACGGRTLVTASQDILDEVAETISRMLDVPRIGEQNDESWRMNRGGSIAMVLGTNYRIERRRIDNE